ncbi:hypothetical protein ABZ759_14795 [Streptomyces sp. NPDC047860]|uniref:hypothetical protein n=1 Tax=Streptomyces sp. NPDC047860 TaxID=3155743 RepID=UPI0033E6F4D8
MGVVEGVGVPFSVAEVGDHLGALVAGSTALLRLPEGELVVFGRFFPPDQYKVLEHLALGASVEQTYVSWTGQPSPFLVDAGCGAG